MTRHQNPNQPGQGGEGTQPKPKPGQDKPGQGGQQKPGQRDDD